MSEEGVSDGPLNRLTRHRFIVMIISTILIALFLVGVALALYASSGAAQLDLSRPGYVSVRNQAAKSESPFDSFPANGSIDKGVLDQFRKLYMAQADKATKVDSFGGTVMNDQTLSIDAPVE